MAVRLVTESRTPQAAAGARLGEWQKAVRDHLDRPPALQCLVLDRLDWNTGTGHASVANLAADAGCKVQTVNRATRWARQHGMLARTKRGHALRNGKGMASEWRLTLPPPASGTGLYGHVPDGLEGANRGLEHARRDTPSSTARRSAAR